MAAHAARWPGLRLLACAAAPTGEEMLAKPVSDAEWQAALQRLVAEPAAGAPS